MDASVSEKWKLLEEKLDSLIASRDQLRKERDGLSGQIQELKSEKDVLLNKIQELETRSSEMEQRLSRGQEVLGRALSRLESALSDNGEGAD